jgi:hypothetical protein
MADPLSPRAAPATGPREPECLCRGRYPFLAHHTPDHCGALAYVSGDPQAPACSVCWTPLAAPASPPPEPAEERRGCADGPRCDHFECVEDRQFRALETRRAAPALPRPEESALSAIRDLTENGSVVALNRLDAVASAPPPRPEESARIAADSLDDADVLAEAVGYMEAGREPVGWLWSSDGPWIAKHLRALSAPPPGEERLRERVEALAVKWEGEAVRFAAVASGSSIDRAREAAANLYKDRRDSAAALRAALREDEKGAKP